MRKDFATIRNNIAQEVYDTSTAMLTLISNYINIKYKEILRRVNFNQYNYDYTITTVAAQKDYPLNEDFGKCIGAFNATRSKELTELNSLEELYRNQPSSISTQGDPSNYIIFNSVVKVQPSTAAAPSFVSSSTQDTTQKILVRGTLASGAETTEQVSLNGTTPASATNSYTYYKGISKDGNTVGTITGTHGSDTITVMAPKILTSRYKIARLWMTPSSVMTINFPYLINPLPLIEDNDYPIIEIEDIIEMGARALAHSYQRREATANKYESIFESMIANFTWNEENNPNRKRQFQPDPYTRNTI